MFRQRLVVLVAVLAAAAAGAVGTFHSAAAAVDPTYDQIVTQPNPIADAGTLAAGAVTPVLVVPELANGDPVGGATVFLSFTKVGLASGVSGGTADVGGIALTAAAAPFVSDASGLITVIYTAPSALPPAGRVVITAQGSTSVITATDDYSFGNVTSYVWSVGPPIASTGILIGDQSVTFTVTATNGADPVPGATIFLSLTTTASPGGSATATDGTLVTPITGTRAGFDANSAGSVSITYTAPTSLPASGVDTLRAENLLATVSRETTYTFGEPTPSLDVVAPLSATAGAPITVTVTAKEGSATDAGYAGTVHFTSTDGAATLPGDYTFTGADAGAHIFSATLQTVGSRTLTATDTQTASITGTAGPIAVSAAPVVSAFHPQDVGAPSTAVLHDGSAQLIFWKSSAGHLMEAWWQGHWNGPVDWTAANGWSPSLASTPSVALAPDGTQVIFWQSTGGHLMEAWWNGAWNGPVDWTAANGWAPSLTSAPSVALAPDGTQVIFWQAVGGHLMEAWWQGHWNGPVDWTAAKGWSPSLASAPSVAFAPDGTQLIFWKGASGHLMEAWWNGVWNGPVDWTAANGWGSPLTSAPSVAIAADGTQVIFWQGAGGHLMEAWWQGHWNGPVDWTAAKGWGSPLTSAPSVAFAPGGTQIIFWQGAGGHLVEAWWNGVWNGPVDWSS